MAIILDIVGDHPILKSYDVATLPADHNVHLVIICLYSHADSEF
jgi:hypothetical protein